MAATENEDKIIQCVFSDNLETRVHPTKFPGTKFKTTLHNKLSNSLPQQIVETKSLNEFKKELDKNHRGQVH